MQTSSPVTKKTPLRGDGRYGFRLYQVVYWSRSLALLTISTSNMSNRHRRPPASRILAVLPAINRALALEVRRAGFAVQLTMAQFSALRLLANLDCSVTEIARTLNVALPTATRNVDALVNKGLAERLARQIDRRHVIIRITCKGRQVEGHCRGQVEAYLANLLSEWPRERQDELARALEQVLALSKEPREAEKV